MHIHRLQELRKRNLLTEEQLQQLEKIETGKIFSVYYELRTVLYLGVLLFTTGVGILIYQNIGELGHVLSIISLFLLTGVCAVYAFRKAPPFTTAKSVTPNPYFDYVVLLGSLLFISGLGYLQFQYGIFSESMGEVTLVTAVFLFAAAYRFDHLGVLSLAITAFGSFWGISLSPQKWSSGHFFDDSHLHITAIFFGAGLAAVAWWLDRKTVKSHFTFTYLNFAALTFLTGALAGIFINDESYGVFLVTLLAGCGLAAYYGQKQKSFLFLLYAFVFGYIGISYFLADTILDDAGIWFLYLLASCGGFIAFIIRFKSYFKRDE